MNKRLTWNSGTSACPAIALESMTRSMSPGVTGLPGLLTSIMPEAWTGGHPGALPTGSPTHRPAPIYPGPAMVIDSNNTIHIVWYLETPNANVYYKRSTDGGENWSPTMRLSWASGSSGYPAVAVDLNNHIYVAWQYYTPGSFEIYYKKSIDGGASLELGQSADLEFGLVSGPAIAIDSDNHIHILWWMGHQAITKFIIGGAQMKAYPGARQTADLEFRQLVRTGHDYRPVSYDPCRLVGSVIRQL